MANNGFRYAPDVVAALEPWRAKLETQFDEVVAKLTDRDRQLEDYVNRLIYDRVNSLITLGGGEIIGPLNGLQVYLPTDQNITIGNGVRSGGFVRIGRLIFVQYDVTFGTTTSFGGNPSIGLPVAAVGGQHSALPLSILDNGTRYYVGTAVVGEVSASLATLTHSEAGNSGIVNATNPMTWATGDRFTVTGFYQAAS